MPENMLPYNEEHTVTNTKTTRKDHTTMTRAKTIAKHKVYKHT